jgi:hypothetical protein
MLELGINSLKNEQKVVSCVELSTGVEQLSSLPQSRMRFVQKKSIRYVKESGELGYEHRFQSRTH